MRHGAICVILLVLISPGCHQNGREATAGRVRTDQALIMGVLRTQARLWNAGDIEGFMAHYWNDERMTFSAGGTTHRGWQAALDRYTRRYPTPAEMGSLTFSDLKTHALGDRSAYVMGRWHVVAENKDTGGLFTLIFRHIDGQWLIVHDHTSMECAN